MNLRVAKLNDFEVQRLPVITDIVVGICILIRSDITSSSSMS
jgi:hypothetical protein